MSISSYVKANRKLIGWLLAVIVVEVSLLIYWGVVAYKNERLDAEAQGKKLIDLLNQKDQEEYERQMKIRRAETQRLLDRFQRLNEKIEKLDDKWRENLAKLALLNGTSHGFEIPIFLDSPQWRNPPGYWDVFPPGHPYGPKVEINLIIKSPKPLSGKPFLGMEGGDLKSLEENAISDQHSRNGN
jgi:hypothetical protein